MAADSRLRLDENFGGRGDDFYAELLRAHEGLDDGQGNVLNARLVLILANHVGDPEVLREAIALARRSIRPVEAAPPAAAHIGHARPRTPPVGR